MQTAEDSRVRAKSQRDILNQYLRLFDNPRMNRERSRKVKDATDRYLQNISGTRTYRRDLDRFRNAPSYAESRRLDYEMQNRKYSQSTYMGLSNG